MDPNIDIPFEFICPITNQIMEDPCVVDDGHTFQRMAIQEWFSNGRNTNPVTNLKLHDLRLRPNFALRSLIQKFIQKHKIGKQIEKSQKLQKKTVVKQKVQKLLTTHKEQKTNAQPIRASNQGWGSWSSSLGWQADIQQPIVQNKMWSQYDWSHWRNQPQQQQSKSGWAFWN